VAGATAANKEYIKFGQKSNNSHCHIVDVTAC